MSSEAHESGVRIGGANADANAAVSTSAPAADASELGAVRMTADATIDGAPCDGGSSVRVFFRVHRGPPAKGARGRAMIATLEASGVALSKKVFEGGDPAICHGAVDPDGKRLRFRCLEDINETRGEIVHDGDALEVRVAEGYFGPTPPDVAPGFGIETERLPLRCGTRVDFQAQSLADPTYASTRRDDTFFKALDARARTTGPP